MQPILVLHGRDLRVDDNPALAEANQLGDPTPVYLLDSKKLRCTARRNFLLESLRDLDSQYREIGSSLAVRADTDIDRLKEESGARTVVRNLDPRTDTSGHETVNPGFLHRDGRNRDTWDEDADSYLDAKPVEKPERLLSNPLDSELDDIDSEKSRKRASRPRGGRKEALQRVEEFGRGATDYVSSISSPSKAEKKGSRLSGHIAYGCVSIREVYQTAANNLSGNDLEALQDRLAWNLHMRQKLLDNPDIPEKEINPVFRGLHRTNTDRALVDAWKNGRTGFPMVDASMRALVETGFLNFRMRAMCASFYTHILRQWWKEGADFMYRHLVDADPAINYYQWQMQSNVTGIHALRIYDPAKQQRENDPDGEFITRHVPELEELPEEHLAEPWKASEGVQRNAECVIGDNYPKPVVDFDRQAEKTRRQFSKLADRAREAFADDDVWKNASLSNRHDRQEILEETSETGNSRLTDFQAD